MQRILDWNPKFDERSKNYPIRSIIPENVKETSKMWQEGVVLDQGQEGACVGFGWMAELLCEPFAPENQPSFEKGNIVASEFYKRAQKIDEWPGENYSGTSVLAGAKIMVADGHIGEYRWCFSVEDLRDAIITTGPVVIGVNWYQGMYETLPNGFVKIEGEKVGGHCITVTGYDSVGKVFRWRNSWGTNYGIGGSAYITYEDMERLIKERAEMCIPVNRKIPVFS